MSSNNTETDGFPTPEVKISPKRERFVLELMVDENLTNAYIRAGYSGLNKTKAGKNASKLAKIPEVAAYIALCREFLRARFAVTAERVIDELGKIAFANAKTYFRFGPDGVRLVDSDDISDQDLAAVKSVSQTETQHGGTIRLELHSKVAALDLLAQHFGLLDKPKAEDPANTAFADLVAKGAAEFDREGLSLH